MGRSFKVLAIHKQMYPATYNFRDEANGTSGTDIDFIDTDSHSDADTSITIVASFANHKKVLKITDANGAGYLTADHSIGSTETNATIEWWWAVSNVTSTDGAKIVFYEGATEICGLYITGDDIHIYNPGITSVKANFLVADTYIHVKMVLDDTANVFDCYINGVLEGNGISYRNNSTTGINKIVVGSGWDDVINVYYDAIGFSFDANYKIGDNCFWKHYKDQDSDFESEDVGTTGTTIACVDGGNDSAHCEIVPFFSEHKKVLRFFDDDGSSDAYIGLTQATADTVELWFRLNDATTHFKLYFTEDATLCFYVKLALDNIYDTNDVDIGDIADNTHYHLKIQWYADNTYDVWLDNVLILDGGALDNNQVSGVNRLHIYGYGNDNTKFLYLDAISQASISGNEVADNRTFDYNATYTSEDITTDVINVLTTNQLGKWLEGTLITKETYKNTEIFVQIYDVNDKLGMEAELTTRDQIGVIRQYPLRDKNEEDLKNESSNTFSAKKIHDPTDSTCMLKVILPNVGEAEGDLLLVDADTKTDTYSPTTKNYPDHKMLTDIADLADSVVIIHPDGKVYMDDDKASGTVLDFDTAADHDKMTEPPLVSDILEEVNYIVVKGAFNPDTGTRFVKVTDNVGSDKKKSWRYTNNNFLNQTDVDKYAAKLVARAITAKKIKFSAQSLGSHNMGETANYKFVDVVYNVPQANYYIIYEWIDYDKNLNVIILSEGMLETSKYAATYEKPEEYSDAYASQIYDTDLITVDLSLFPIDANSSVSAYGIKATAVVAGARGFFYLDDKVDDSRDIEVTYSARNGVNGALTFDGATEIWVLSNDGSADGIKEVDNNSADFVFTEDYGRDTIADTLAAGDFSAGNQIEIIWQNAEGAKDIYITNIQVRYYQKRIV